MPVKNRTIPFGYQYENGVLAINPPEAHTVQKVFTAYLSGEPSAKLLPTSPPSWWSTSRPLAMGQARVKRLLDNAKYTGEDDFSSHL